MEHSARKGPRGEKHRARVDPLAVGQPHTLDPPGTQHQARHFPLNQVDVAQALKKPTNKGGITRLVTLSARPPHRRLP